MPLSSHFRADLVHLYYALLVPRLVDSAGNRVLACAKAVAASLAAQLRVAEVGARAYERAAAGGARQDTSRRKSAQPRRVENVASRATRVIRRALLFLLLCFRSTVTMHGRDASSS